MFDYAVLCDSYDDSAALFELFCSIVHSEFQDSGEDYDYEIDMPTQTLYMFCNNRPAVRYIFIDHHMEPFFGQDVEILWADDFFDDLWWFGPLEEWAYENSFG